MLLYVIILRLVHIVTATLWTGAAGPWWPGVARRAEETSRSVTNYTYLLDA